MQPLQQAPVPVTVYSPNPALFKDPVTPRKQMKVLFAMQEQTFGIFTIATDILTFKIVDDHNSNKSSALLRLLREIMLHTYI